MHQSQEINPVIYDKLLESQQQLTKYLKYIRYKQPVPRIQLPSLHEKQPFHPIQTNKTPKIKKQAKQIKPFINRYFTILREVFGLLQNSMSKKIIKKTLQFLQEFPTMAFLIQVTNSFGKEKKKLCMNEAVIQAQVSDDMIPLFEKIIQKIQSLKRQSESKKLMELGHRIEHLQILIDNTKDKVKKTDQNQKIFRTFESDRIEKYLLMEDNINKAQKNYGKFSQNLSKNREIFSNINKVYLQIKNSSYGQ